MFVMKSRKKVTDFDEFLYNYNFFIITSELLFFYIFFFICFCFGTFVIFLLYIDSCNLKYIDSVFYLNIIEY